MNGAEAIAFERLRQEKAEGYSAEHDDGHNGGELVTAGLGYTVTARAQIVSNIRRKGPEGAADLWATPPCFIPEGWPEGWEFKASPDPMRNLQKGGALIAGELDRLSRIRGIGWGGMSARDCLAAIRTDPRTNLPQDLLNLIDEVLIRPGL